MRGLTSLERKHLRWLASPEAPAEIEPSEADVLDSLVECGRASVSRETEELIAFDITDLGELALRVDALTPEHLR